MSKESFATWTTAWCYDDSRYVFVSIPKAEVLRILDIAKSLSNNRAVSDSNSDLAVYDLDHAQVTAGDLMCSKVEVFTSSVCMYVTPMHVYFKFELVDSLDEFTTQLIHLNDLYLWSVLD